MDDNPMMAHARKIASDYLNPPMVCDMKVTEFQQLLREFAREQLHRGYSMARSDALKALREIGLRSNSKAMTAVCRISIPDPPSTPKES